jgi:hypothetical protein
MTQITELYHFKIIDLHKGGFLSMKSDLESYQLDLFQPVLAARKVGANCHITFEGVHYSVPHVFIKSMVIVRTANTFIDILDAYGRCIASHKRSHCKRAYITEPSHMPTSYYSSSGNDCFDGAAFRKWADSIGDNVSLFIDSLLASKDIEEHSYNACMAILQLSKKYSLKCFNDACGRALSSGKVNYYSVRKFLSSSSSVDTSHTI